MAAIIDLPLPASRRAWQPGGARLWRLGDLAELAGDTTPYAVTEIAFPDEGELLLGLSERFVPHRGRYFVRASRVRPAAEVR